MMLQIEGVTLVIQGSLLQKVFLNMKYTPPFSKTNYLYFKHLFIGVTEKYGGTLYTVSDLYFTSVMTQSVLQYVIMQASEQCKMVLEYTNTPEWHTSSTQNWRGRCSHTYCIS